MKLVTGEETTLKKGDYICFQKDPPIIMVTRPSREVPSTGDLTSSKNTLFSVQKLIPLT